MSYRHSFVLAPVAAVIIGCRSVNEPSSGPLVDIVGRATLPSGAPAAGVTISSRISDPDKCGLPVTPGVGRTATTIADANGAYRLRAPAESSGLQCVMVGARLSDGGPGARVDQVAEARTRPPFVVVKADLVLR